MLYMNGGYKRIAARTPHELIARAVEYRRMADTATTAHVRDALVRLAIRFEATAAERAKRLKSEGPSGSSPAA
jgi:hypothetical protein